MTITPRQMLVDQSKWGVKCPYPMTPEFIVVHNTANDASANNEISYMRNNNNEVSYHFAVDDKEVVQGIRLDRNAWHAGDGGSGRGNRKGIGIEICYSLSGGERFTKAEQLAAKFIAQLLKERNWNISKVTKHQDYSGKYCPHRTLDLGWERFKNMVQTELNALSKPTIEWFDDVVHVITVEDTALVDIVTGTIIKTYPKNTEFDFAQHCTYNGKAYYRTDYSKQMGVNNGILMSACAPLAEEQPIKLNWVSVNLPDMITKDGCVLRDLKENKVVKEYQRGEIIKGLTQKTIVDGITYYRTNYSALHSVDNGFSEEYLEEYVEVKPDPELPNIPPEEVIEPPEDEAIEPEEDGEGKGDINQLQGLFMTIVEAIIKFIKVLFGKGE